MSLDTSILFSLNGLAGRWPIFDYIIVFFASYFQYLVVASLAVFLFYSGYPYRKKYKIFFVSIAAAVIARFGLAELIRFFFYRDRPFLVYNNIHALLADYESSFPSGHAIFFFASSMVIYKYNKRWGYWFFGASLLIGISRVIGGIHYPSDILGGIILGLITGYLTYKLAERQKKVSSAN